MAEERRATHPECANCGACEGKLTSNAKVGLFLQGTRPCSYSYEPAAAQPRHGRTNERRRLTSSRSARARGTCTELWLPHFSLAAVALVTILALAPCPVLEALQDCRTDPNQPGCHLSRPLTICVDIHGGKGNDPFVVPIVAKSVDVGSSEVEFKEYTLSEFYASFKGFDVDLLAAMASMMFPDHEVVVQAHHDKSSFQKNVVHGICDFGIGALTQTHKQMQCDKCEEAPPLDAPWKSSAFCCLDFTDHYFSDGWAVLLRKDAAGGGFGQSALAKSFWQPPVLFAVGILILSLLGSGHALWLLEKDENSIEFNQSYLDGVDDGIWWSFVTMTTVGYGDKVPVTMTGRFIACLWMVIGILLFGVFNGAILLAMTPQETMIGLASMDDDMLRDGTTLCAEQSEGSRTFLAGYGLGNHTDFRDTVDDCLDPLRFKRVKGILHNRLLLLNRTNEWLPHFPQGLEAGPAFKTLQFSVVMPKGAERNQLIAESIRKTNDGAVVYSDFHDFGFTMFQNRLIWTNFNVPLDTTYSSTSQYSEDDWKHAQIMMGVALGVLFIYLCVQFGGLWIRRHLRIKELERQGKETTNVPYQDDGRTRDPEKVVLNALDSAGVAEAVFSLEEQVRSLLASQERISASLFKVEAKYQETHERLEKLPNQEQSSAGAIEALRPSQDGIKEDHHHQKREELKSRRASQADSRRQSRERAKGAPPASPSSRKGSFKNSSIREYPSPAPSYHLDAHSHYSLDCPEDVKILLGPKRKSQRKFDDVGNWVNSTTKHHSFPEPRF